MNILLITPVINSENKSLKKTFTAPLALYKIQGLTPPEHKVEIIWWDFENMDLDREYDLVGISCMTANAPKAYELAKEFRKRGRTVVLGGIHPTVMPDEALQYADCVVIGEVEGVWNNLIEDFQKGELKKIYHEPNPDLSKYIAVDYKNMIVKGFSPLMPILATRGCPFNCNFCSVSDIYGEKIKHIPIENVIREIKSSKYKNFVFFDDNIIGDPVYAKELFKNLIPLKIKWYGNASISIADNLELLHLAAESGCQGIFIGIESVNNSQLRILSKQYDCLEKVEVALKKIKKAGLLVYASIVFGFDSDTKDIFAKTVKFLQKNGVCSVGLHILTPYPGTKLFADMKKENRLLTENWKFYDNITAVFKPKNMTPYELQYETLRANQQFYSFLSIAKRFFRNLQHPLIFLSVNVFYRKLLKKEEQRISNIDHFKY